MPPQVSIKKTVTSLSFINFTSEDTLVRFAAAFNGHVFVNERGTPYKISIEYAPFQKARASKIRLICTALVRQVTLCATPRG